MSRGLKVCLVVVVAIACAPAASSADVTAVLAQVTPGRTDLNIVRVNAGSGAVTGLPFNTTANELHPSVSSDGNRIAFERLDQATEQVSLWVYDARANQTVEVPTPSQIVARGESSPGISPDGRTLLTGGYFGNDFTNQFFPTVTTYDLSTFPNGPFALSTYQTQYSLPVGGKAWDPVESGSLLAFDLAGTALGSANATVEGIVLAQLGGFATPVLNGAFEPAIGSPGGVPTVLFEAHSAGSLSYIASRPASPLASFPGPPTPLPALVNDPAAHQLAPAFTADGRYVGFLRVLPGSVDARLFVFDTETQTLLNPAGVDVGDIAGTPFLHGAELEVPHIGLYDTAVFLGIHSIPLTGVVTFTTTHAALVGIFVQRVVGHHLLFGRTVPTLRPVGRVPLGMFKKGTRHVHWNLTVNGHRLKRGTYQVVLRALNASQQVLDLGVPNLIHVR
jgi:hypothetical protein